MARVAYSPAALRDLERLIDFLMEQDAGIALETADLIIGALTMLEDHPLLGRAIRDELRELVISHGQSGYLALYDYHAGEGEVLILSIRHQREAGYTDPSILD